jgi:hypothetical protein
MTIAMPSGWPETSTSTVPQKHSPLCVGIAPTSLMHTHLIVIACPDHAMSRPDGSRVCDLCSPSIKRAAADQRHSKHIDRYRWPPVLFNRPIRSRNNSALSIWRASYGAGRNCTLVFIILAIWPRWSVSRQSVQVITTAIKSVVYRCLAGIIGASHRAMVNHAQ